MSTRGFEFAYMLDGSGATPLIRDFILGGASAAHLVGDLMLMQSDGYVDRVTTTTTEVTGVMQEAVGTADITAGTTLAKLAIITRNQVWRCSMDATVSAATVGYHKKFDTVDANTIDADDTTTGAMILLDKSRYDADGNILGYVVFSDTTFGNT